MSKKNIVFISLISVIVFTVNICNSRKDLTLEEKQLIEKLIEITNDHNLCEMGKLPFNGGINGSLYLKDIDHRNTIYNIDHSVVYEGLESRNFECVWINLNEKVKKIRVNEVFNTSDGIVIVFTRQFIFFILKEKGSFIYGKYKRK